MCVERRAGRDGDPVRLVHDGVPLTSGEPDLCVPNQRGMSWYRACCDCYNVFCQNRRWLFQCTEGKDVEQTTERLTHPGTDNALLDLKVQSKVWFQIPGEYFEWPYSVYSVYHDLHLIILLQIPRTDNEDVCYEFKQEQNLVHRTHLYYMEFSYTPVSYST